MACIDIIMEKYLNEEVYRKEYGHCGAKWGPDTATAENQQK